MTADIPQVQIEKLTAFRQREKFSDEAWRKRGLQPSPEDVSGFLSAFFDGCTDKIIGELVEGRSGRHLKSMLKKELSSLNKSKFDTEEKELICELFYEIAAVVNVDIKTTLNTWLYGRTISGLMQLQKLLSPERIADTLHQACSGCKADLATYILRKEASIPETSWFIIRCNKCGELNLLSFGPGVKQSRFGNYSLVETLRMHEYTQAEALVRLEQIKYFRKP